MLRLAIAVLTVLFSGVCVYAQLNKCYILKDSPNFDTVNFHLKASIVNCLFSKSDEDKNPLTIHGHPNHGSINSSFFSHIKNKVCYSSLTLDQSGHTDFGKSFSMAVSRKIEKNEFWKVDFSENKIYILNFQYSFGVADLDLTGSTVKHLQVNSGSADITVGYDEDCENPIEMDTFFVKTDFGSIVVNHLQSMKAKKVITKVGIGNVLLIINKKLNTHCEVDASVGAGNLEVFLPASHTPVTIYVKDSPLSMVNLPNDFEEVEKNIFANHHYTTESPNILRFNIDVAFGMVRFYHEDR